MPHPRRPRTRKSAPVPTPEAPAPRARALLIAIGVALLALAAWWALGRGGAGRERGLSVLLVTVDTLRADAMGSPRGETPWLDRLAASGVRFEAAHAHNVLTLPS